MTPKASNRADETPAPLTSPAASERPARQRRRARSAPRAERSPYAESISEICDTASRLQSFALAVRSAELADMLGGDEPMTVFAPTDRAFAKMGEDAWEKLVNDPERMAELVRHHVVTGRVKAPVEGKPRQVTPQFGEELTLTSTAGVYRVSGARIVKTNLRATNGVVHAIDTVLIPS